MANIKIIKGEFEKELALPMAPDIFANAIKHEHRSKNPTTRWSEEKTMTHHNISLYHYIIRVCNIENIL